MHPGLELVGEMKRLRRAPEPTSAMEPWRQKAVHDKVLIEKSTRVRTCDLTLEHLIGRFRMVRDPSVNIFC